MSVVVYRDGVMAADSRVVINDSHHMTMKKMVRGNDNQLVGVCGSLVDCQQFLNWYSTPAPADENESNDPVVSDLDALVINADGTAYGYFDSLVPIEIEAEYFAIGSGAEVALGALASGATAEEAVEAACKHVTTCGLPVMVERL